MFGSQVRIVSPQSSDEFQKVNTLLASGWRLLAIPQTGDAEYQDFMYILGWDKEEDPIVTSRTLDEAESRREREEMEKYRF